MYYKLSNTAERKRIESSFQVSFKHPSLYRPAVVINGLAESNLPIITACEPDMVSLAIWGMLPEHYKDDWEHFQNLTNTLNIDERHIDSNLWYTEAFVQRRCLILVTGFFTTFLKDGVTYPYYVGYNSGEPFYLAGVYNILEDGFITCSLVVGKSNAYIQKFQNVVDAMPILVPKNASDYWLDKNVPLTEIQKFLSETQENNLRANPIAKEFFNQNISYDTMLETYAYEDLPFDK